jgi:hypothetical protein
LALLRMNRLGEVTPFPPSLAVFNHAVCYLPDQDLWLDGTAALFDIYDFPPQDQGTLALVLDGRGGRLTTTPVTPADRNLTDISLDIAAQADGSAKVQARIGLSGTVAPELRVRFLGKTDPREMVEKTFNDLYPGARAETAEIANLDSPELPLLATALLSVPMVGRADRGRLDLLALGRETGYQRVLAALPARRTDLFFGALWSVRWKVRWTPPPGFRLGQEPEGGRLQSPFGIAALQVTRQDQALLVTAEFRLDKTRIRPSEYVAFREFLGQADRLLSRRFQLTGDSHAGS